MQCQVSSNTELKIISRCSQDTRTLGLIIGGVVYPGLTLLLRGGLGAGKTLFTQGLGDALCIKRIKSPTFIIVNEHEGRIPLAHADLYRLESQIEADYLDLESYLEQGYVLVVEWAERWDAVPRKNVIEITFETFINDENTRMITIHVSCDIKDIDIKSLAVKIMKSEGNR